MNTSLKFLVEEIKVDLDAPEPLSGDPPIHTAVAWGRPEVVAYLLAKGANANALDAEGLTPLQAAKRRQALLESGDAKYVNRCEEQGMDIKSCARAARPRRAAPRCRRRERLREPLAQGQAAVLLEPVRDGLDPRWFRRRAPRAFRRSEFPTPAV